MEQHGDLEEQPTALTAAASAAGSTLTLGASAHCTSDAAATTTAAAHFQ
jgi:hypothetical protein